MYLLQQLNIHSNIRDQMTDGYMYVGQPTYNYTWFSRYVCMPAMLYEIYNREVHGTKQQHIVRGNVLFSSSPEYIVHTFRASASQNFIDFLAFMSNFMEVHSQTTKYLESNKIKKMVLCLNVCT